MVLRTGFCWCCCSLCCCAWRWCCEWRITRVVLSSIAEYVVCSALFLRPTVCSVSVSPGAKSCDKDEAYIDDEEARRCCFASDDGVAAPPPPPEAPPPAVCLNTHERVRWAVALSLTSLLTSGALALASSESLFVRVEPFLDFDDTAAAMLSQFVPKVFDRKASFIILFLSWGPRAPTISECNNAFKRIVPDVWRLL